MCQNIHKTKTSPPAATGEEKRRKPNHHVTISCKRDKPALFGVIVSFFQKSVNWKDDKTMKNANGMGTITKRKGVRKPYLVYGAAVLVDGIYKREYLGSFKTKKEAEERRIAYFFNPEIKRSDITLKELFEEYQTTKRYQNLSKSSKNCYNTAFKRSAKYHNFTFANLRTANMQEIIDKVEADGKSRALQEQIINFFRVLYEYAIKNDIVQKNYAQFLEIGLKDSTDRRALTDLEIEKIRVAAVSGNTTAQWVIYLIYSGWRISEMLELTRFNYDEPTHSFTGGKKTSAGKNRIVPVHSGLQWIIDKQLALNGQTIFCKQDGSTVDPQYFRNNMFIPLKSELGLDNAITPHFTRHTFATKLKDANADEFYRKKLLGHSMSNITDSVYTHAQMSKLRETIELLNPNCPSEKGNNSSATRQQLEKKRSKTA